MRNAAQAVLLGVCGVIVLRGGKKGYGAFLRGAGEGLQTALGLIPAVTAMTLMLSLMTTGGLTVIFTRLLSPLTDLLGLPQEVTPILILRPLTGSGSLTALQEVFDRCGVDSRAGKVASVLMGSSETIFYTLTVYLGATDVRRAPLAVPVSLISYLAGAAVTSRLM